LDLNFTAFGEILQHFSQTLHFQTENFTILNLNLNIKCKHPTFRPKFPYHTNPGLLQTQKLPKFRQKQLTVVDICVSVAPCQQNSLDLCSVSTAAEQLRGRMLVRLRASTDVHHGLAGADVGLQLWRD
jgi:hypothetical protein